jgi:hypothetical protein
VDERLLVVRLGRARCLAGEPLGERGAATARAAVIRDHPPCRRVEPDARPISLGNVVDPPPGREEDVRNRVLWIDGGPGPPAAVRDDVGAVRGEELVEPPLTIGLGPH